LEAVVASLWRWGSRPLLSVWKNNKLGGLTCLENSVALKGAGDQDFILPLNQITLTKTNNQKK